MIEIDRIAAAVEATKPDPIGRKVVAIAAERLPVIFEQGTTYKSSAGGRFTIETGIPPGMKLTRATVDHGVLMLYFDDTPVKEINIAIRCNPPPSRGDLPR